MVLPRLREETRPAHERLETHIDLLGREWTIPFYKRLLEKFYGFYAVIEPPIFNHPQWQPVGIEVDERRKSQLLIQDLKFLGLGAKDIESLPKCQNAPVAESFAQALGCAYVLEGSTLGGQVITRHLKRELDVETERGATFFTSYGPAVGPMWRDFTQVLNTYELSEKEKNALVQSACSTFSTFDAWLSDIL